MSRAFFLISGLTILMIFFCTGCENPSSESAVQNQTSHAMVEHEVLNQQNSTGSYNEEVIRKRDSTHNAGSYLKKTKQDDSLIEQLKIYFSSEKANPKLDKVLFILKDGKHEDLSELIPDYFYDVNQKDKYFIYRKITSKYLTSKEQESMLELVGDSFCELITLKEEDEVKFSNGLIKKYLPAIDSVVYAEIRSKLISRVKSCLVQ